MMETVTLNDINNNNMVSATDEEDVVLLSLVQQYDWIGTLERIQTHPEECQAIGNLGRTALHVACDHDAPPAVIQALTRAYPQAILQVGTTHMNPLHIVCSSDHASPEVIRLLLVESGAALAKQVASMVDVDGDTPLHSACRCGASVDVIKLLLRVHPDAVHVRDFEGLTPLQRLWVREFVLLGSDVINNVQSLSDFTGELGEAWKKTMLLLYCADMGSLNPTATPPATDGVATNSQPRKIFRPLHAVAAIDCPRRVVRIATIVYKDQLLVRDEQGNTPLLLASKAPVYKFQDIGFDGPDLDEKLEEHYYGEDNNNDDDDMDMSVKTDSSVPNQLPSVIDVFMQAEPAAAKMADAQGKLPLQHAMETEKTWNQGVRVLTEAEGDVEKDLVTGLERTVQLNK